MPAPEANAELQANLDVCYVAYSVVLLYFVSSAADLRFAHGLVIAVRSAIELEC